MKISLQMASVQYVHTQRFQTEVVAFIQHFTQLQDVLGRQRAAVEGQAVSRPFILLVCLVLTFEQRMFDLHHSKWSGFNGDFKSKIQLEVSSMTLVLMLL